MFIPPTTRSIDFAQISKRFVVPMEHIQKINPPPGGLFYNTKVNTKVIPNELM